MKAYAQVISTPTVDTPGTAILLQFDNKRYLIGRLFEGLQRNNIQMSVRHLKISELFMSGRCEWQSTGGVVGYILSHADAIGSSLVSQLETAKNKARAHAVKQGFSNDQAKVDELIEKFTVSNTTKLDIFAPPNFTYQLATNRRYVLRKGMPITVHEIDTNTKPLIPDTSDPTVYWSDQNIKVYVMPIDSSTSSEQHSRPVNGRKRSYEELDADEAMDDTDQSASKNEMSSAERPSLYQKLVKEMYDSVWQDQTEQQIAKANKGSDQSNITEAEAQKLSTDVTGSLPDPVTKATGLRWSGKDLPPPLRNSKTAVSYIFRIPPQRGPFDPKKAHELKVPKGFKFRDLTQGKSVLNTDGETIHPEQVLGPGRPSRAFAVVDIPDETYIDNLLAREEWTSLSDNIAFVFWLCSPAIMQDARIQSFMRRTKEIEHIISNDETSSNHLAFDASAAANTRMAKVDAKRYRAPFYSDKLIQYSAEPSIPNVRSAARGQVVQLEPRVEFIDDYMVKPVNLDDSCTHVSDYVLNEVEKAKASLQKDESLLKDWASTIPGRDVEICTLGTGSAIPSKDRNVSSTLMRVPGWGSMLFDCGEGTVGQLRRAYPDDEYRQILRDLKLLWISHMHADHHMGTIGLIKAWYQEVHGSQPPSDSRKHQNNLTIIAPDAMHSFLYEYSAIEDYGYSRLERMHFVVADPSKSKYLVLRMFGETGSQTAVPPSKLGLKDIRSVGVAHAADSSAVSITWPDGFKASYSGDCRPSKPFAHIGAGSTICIHEATFTDDMIADAKYKKHSTISEALDVARDMNAKACILTHFSQRYQTLPTEQDTELSENPISKAGQTTAVMKVAFAFDLMRVKVGEMAEVPYFMKATQMLLAEEESDSPVAQAV